VQAQLGAMSGLDGGNQVTGLHPISQRHQRLHRFHADEDSLRSSKGQHTSGGDQPAKAHHTCRGATMLAPEAARSRPRWPGPQGVLGARKSRKTFWSPSVGHSQIASGTGGSITRRTSSKAPGIIPAVWGMLWGCVSAPECVVDFRGGARELDNCADTVRTPWNLRSSLPFS